MICLRLLGLPQQGTTGRVPHKRDIYFWQLWRLGSPRARRRHWQVRALFLVRSPAFSLGPVVGAGGAALNFLNSLIPSRMALPSGLITRQRLHLLIPSPLRVRISQKNLGRGDTNIQTIPEPAEGSCWFGTKRMEGWRLASLASGEAMLILRTSPEPGVACCRGGGGQKQRSEAGARRRWEGRAEVGLAQSPWGSASGSASGHYSLFAVRGAWPFSVGSGEPLKCLK